MSVRDDGARVESLSVLSAFRTEFYRCLTARADVLFEVTDALLCTDGPVRSLVDLVLAPEHRRGHGGMYDGLNCGRIDIARLRQAVAGLPLPRAADGRIVLAVDVSPWLRTDARTSPDRLFCHVYGRGKSQAQLIPGSSRSPPSASPRCRTRRSWSWVCATTGTGTSRAGPRRWAWRRPRWCTRSSGPRPGGAARPQRGGPAQVTGAQLIRCALRVGQKLDRGYRK
ncbi:transposase [Micromonospora fulviviridis]|uniref:transposase n=1 Tax=Micromonospora fulviviridis TaxID=47860 RepID=UPI0037BD011A